MTYIIRIISGTALIVAGFAGMLLVCSNEINIDSFYKFMLAMICLTIMISGFNLLPLQTENKEQHLQEFNEKVEKIKDIDEISTGTILIFNGIPNEVPKGWEVIARVGIRCYVIEKQ